MLSILIADDHPLFRVGLKYALEDYGFKVIAEASDGEEALEAAKEYPPDALLLDIKMPVLDGIEVCKQARKFLPEALIIMLTTFEEEAIIQAARKAGANGFFSKETEPRELAKKIEMIVANPTHDWLPKVALPEFTSRERQVLELLNQGHTNKKIAQDLCISPETVKSYLSNIYQKLGVSDRLAAVRKAQELGIFTTRT